MVYFKVANPLADSNVFRLIIKKECKSINGDPFYEENRVIGPYSIYSKHFIPIYTRDHLSFFTPYPIAETIEQSLELITKSVEFDPPPIIPGEWFAPNHFLFRYCENSFKSIKCQITIKDQLYSLLGVEYYLNLKFSQEMMIVDTNFDQFLQNNFPTRPQLYFEFDQLVDTESFVQAVIISKPSSDPVAVILLNGDEITCPTIPLERKEGYYVCVTIAKSDQIHPYLDPSTYYYSKIDGWKSLEGPNPVSRGFDKDFTTCS